MPKQQLAKSKREPRSQGKKPARRAVAAPPTTRTPAQPISTVRTRARRSSATDTQLRFHLASLLRLSDNIVTKAVQAYDRLFALDGEDQVAICLQLGKELANRDKLPEALQALRKAQKLKPEDANVLTEIGIVHLRRHAPEAALGAFDRASALGHEAYRLHKYRAEALLELGRDTEALAEQRAAYELKPNVHDAAYRLASTLDRVGKAEEAVEILRKAIELSPNVVSYHQSLGFTLDALGRRSEAIQCFKRALELERHSRRRAAI